jgi:RimJ/RimL family protein N-acetyltransferase
VEHLQFDQDIILENDVVKLRPLQKEDFELLLPFSIHEPDLWEFSLVPGNGEENLRAYMDLAFKARAEKDSYPFIVFDKLKKEYAGSTRFYDYRGAHQTVQLGYTWYGKQFQGTKLNKNCKFIMLSYAFDQLGLGRVEFRADNDNVRSIAAMKSLGCVEEGVLRSNCASPTGRRDSIVLSILKSEWKESVKEKLKSKLD